MSDQPSSTTDHNPFRENEPLKSTNLIVDSSDVGFAERSPSIIPTPVYDDSSSFMSSPISSPAISSVGAASAISPSPLSNQISQNSAYGSKIEVGNDTASSVYGPTFKDDDTLQQYNPNEMPSSSGLNRGDFVPLKENEDGYQLYETSNQNKLLFQPHPPPEQTRVDIFMSKLKGYQKPSDMEQGEDNYDNIIPNTTRGFKENDDDLVRQMPKQRGLLFRQLFGSTKYPIFTWVTSFAMLGVFIYELVRNHQLSGSWIQTNPFNPMVGPNYMALVNMGSKFVPCMRETTQYPSTTLFANCYQSTESTCTVEELCGFGGFGTIPNQTFRFFTSIFLHAGVIHILINLLTHLQLGGEIERKLGLLRYMILYFVSGIWGFVLSGVLSGLTVSSMGCSGSLFGLVGFQVTDILIRWKEIRRPVRELVVLLCSAAFALVLGLFPGIDNFAHIGGFVMGLLFGVILTSLSSFASRRAVIITWIAKIVCLVIAIVLYVVFLRIFYTSSDLSAVCPGCKYLSCLPIKDWCDV